MLNRTANYCPRAVTGCTGLALSETRGHHTESSFTWGVLDVYGPRLSWGAGSVGVSGLSWGTQGKRGAKG